jgi:hypothetical protein
VPLSFDSRGHLTVQADTVGQVGVILDVNGYFK